MQPSSPEIALPTKVVRLGVHEVAVATTVGPRILGFRRVDGPPVFASLPSIVIDHPDGGRFSFHGGHRLWRAPEVPTVTYRPDDDPVEILEDESGIVVSDRGDGEGVVRRLRVEADGEYARVTHTLENLGDHPVVLAPWAITQLRVGGTAFLPQNLKPQDRDGLLPNRSVILWPYTDPSDPGVRFGREMVTVDVDDASAKFKIGYPNRRGWCGYLVHQELFVKWAPVLDESAATVDMGATMQCYRDERFLELESVGPLVTLGVGATTDHVEWWRMFDVSTGSVDDLLESLPEVPRGGS